MNPIITTHHLSFQDKIIYPDIAIYEHEITFISGASGSGKSTLLKLINASLNPSSGHVKFLDQNITEIDKIKLRRQVLLVGQIPYLFTGTIKDNFKEYHQYQESTCPQDQDIQKYLDICCLDKDINTSCDTMSGGERQRAFLAIALSLKPRILMLDEPTSALNSELSTQVISQVIQYLKEHHMTLIMVSHDLSLQEKFAERVISMEANL